MVGPRAGIDPAGYRAYGVAVGELERERHRPIHEVQGRLVVEDPVNPEYIVQTRVRDDLIAHVHDFLRVLDESRRPARRERPGRTSRTPNASTRVQRVELEAREEVGDIGATGPIEYVPLDVQELVAHGHSRVIHERVVQP